MAEASIPVDLRNPGQVFACLGLMEAAEVLGLKMVTGRFIFGDRNDDAEFVLTSEDGETPLKPIFGFFDRAKLKVYCPATIEGAWPAEAVPTMEIRAPAREFLKSDGVGTTRNALPVELVDGDFRLPVSSWLEGDGRVALKNFAGNQIAAKLIADLLDAVPGKISVRSVMREVEPIRPYQLFQKVGAVGGKFGFDARGAWEARHTGTSLEAINADVAVSPVVELLAVIGLESSRPDFLDGYNFSYNVWNVGLPTALARSVLAPNSAFFGLSELRTFKANLGSDKYYKKCFFAEE